MTADNKRAPAQGSKLSKRERWGQVFLVLAIFLNGAVLLINLKMSGLQNELDANRRDVQNYMTNHQTTYAEISNQTITYTSLNQLKMLRRLSKGMLSSSEHQALSQDEKDLEESLKASSFKIISGIYLNGLDVPGGADPNKLFTGLSQDSLNVLYPKYVEMEVQRSNRLVAKSYELVGKISYWKPFSISATILSTILVLVGNIFWFKAGKQLKADLPKTT